VVVDAERGLRQGSFSHDIVVVHRADDAQIWYHPPPLQFHRTTGEEARQKRNVHEGEEYRDAGITHHELSSINSNSKVVNLGIYMLMLTA
jgi:hypothetical protein